MSMEITAAALPTLYQYYTENGITAGLSDEQPYFTLNHKNITIYSGAFHYFRVPRTYWRDRLKKIRAAGLNTVETYIPWNLHEPYSGVYDFGHGGSEMEDFLDIEEFIKTAQEEDLLVLIRSGPYINSEWEFGGLPSWLMRVTKTVRNSKDANFLTYVKRYFNILLPILALLQFQKSGAIIGFQIENEYANTGRHDLPYLQALRKMFLDHGIVELLYTADSPKRKSIGAIPGVLQTANFNVQVKQHLDMLVAMQPNKPVMTMEYWTGWWDHWLDDHHFTVPIVRFTENLEKILDYPSSVNLYMFVGGTDFGFTNGATMSSRNFSDYKPDTTSYDYDAPLTEYGAYTPKYSAVRAVISKRNKLMTKIPNPPKLKPLIAYGTLESVGQLLLGDVITNLKVKINSKELITMEKLPINQNSGQSYGYIVYRKRNVHIPVKGVLKISGYVRDTVIVLINGELVSRPPQILNDINGFGFWRLKDSTLELTGGELIGATIDLIVENFGRNTLAAHVLKGIAGDIYINNKKLNDWEIAPLEFKKSWNNALSGWHNVINRINTAAFYKFSLKIEENALDTFLDMRNWNKGIVIVNGFVLGRYFFLGPQQTLYLPAPFLKSGSNSIIVFEHFTAPEVLKFVSGPIYGSPGH